jgi:UDP-glucose 4-epimerase
MKVTDMSVVVTGGAGFIGSHLVERLVGEGAHVTVLDNFQSGTLKNIASVADSVHVVTGDVRDMESLTVIADADIVFHLAANASVPLSVENPRYDFETNALGTFNILEASLHSDVKKIVYASSAAVYGEPVYTPIDENHPLQPISPYGVSKLAGEKAGETFKKVYGLPFAAVRIFNTYGPRQPRYVMYDFIKKLKKTPQILEVLGTGEQIRDYCYVSDMVDVFMAVAEKGDSIYNAAGGVSTSIKKLAELMVAALSPDTEICYTGTSWKGDITTLTADITKLKQLGVEPKIPLREGVQKLIQWFEEV